MQLHLSIIVAALVEGARDKRGVEWCRKWGIGYARRRVGSGAKITAANDVIDAKALAANELRSWCRECGRCRMAEE